MLILALPHPLSRLDHLPPRTRMSGVKFVKRVSTFARLTGVKFAPRPVPRAHVGRVNFVGFVSAEGMR